MGRNYIEVGEYIEKVFPKYGIRFIAVEEKYDSDNSNRNKNSNNDVFFMGIKNIVNEWYARESGRKVSDVKQYQKSKGGYVGNFAPYGYSIVIKDGIRTLKEAETMEIVKKICELKNRGYTSAEIAKWLDNHRVNRPSVYNATGKIYYTDTSINFKKWSSGSVRRLWNMRTYTSGDDHTA